MPRANKTIHHPNTLHYIWEGCELPVKFIPTLMKTAAKAQATGYHLKLWVDHPEHYHASLRRYSDIERIPGLELCNLHSLNRVIEKNFNPEDARFLNQILAEEAVGGKNMAALSDIQRLLILLDEGGTYCDLDNSFNDFYSTNKGQKLDYSSISGALETHRANKNLGFNTKKSYKVKGFEPIYSQHGFLLSDAGAGKKDKVQNSLLSAIPQHPLIKRLLDNILKEYRRLSTETGKAIHRHGITFFPSKIDQKRNPRPDVLGRLYKFAYTIETTGPALFKNTINDYEEETGIRSKELIRNLSELGNYAIESDESWLTEDEDLRTYDVEKKVKQRHGEQALEKNAALKKHGKRAYDTHTMAEPNQARRKLLSRADSKNILEKHENKHQKEPLTEDNAKNTPSISYRHKIKDIKPEDINTNDRNSDKPFKN